VSARGDWEPLVAENLVSAYTYRDEVPRRKTPRESPVLRFFCMATRLVQKAEFVCSHSAVVALFHYFCLLSGTLLSLLMESI
jgi:hypothetical protein